ncbi:hypothetical protein SVAN01_07985 [Stagonosporopsis vannaccii]|nr:hypothetical protein SVAN01_07985 [Stagonosporopsis vannaccii]
MPSVSNIPKTPAAGWQEQLLDVANEVALKWPKNTTGLHVQLMTCAQHATAETRYHAVVAMYFDGFAIIIDHALHSVAFAVPLYGEFYMAPYIPLFGTEGQERFKYFLNDGEYKLTMFNKECTYGALSFSEMDVDAARNQLAIPAALEEQQLQVKDYIIMPPRKYLSVHSLLDEEPQLIAAEPVDGEWLATTVRVQVDFVNPVIEMQIPMNDWLLSPQSEDWHRRLFHETPSVLRIVSTPAVVRLELYLHAAERVQPHYELSRLVLMQAIGEELRLDYVVLSSMMWSVYRVWAPYRSMRGDSVIDGGSLDDEVYIVLKPARP